MSPRPGGRYPSPGLVIACCLSLVAMGCVVALGFIVMSLAP